MVKLKWQKWLLLLICVFLSFCLFTGCFIMDEPTSHLDFYNQHIIMEILRGIVEEKGCCAIVSMHDPNLTMRFADNVLMIKEGRMLKEGETLEVMTSGNLCELYNMDIKIADFEGKRNFVYV